MKPIRAIYKPANPASFGYGVKGEVIFTLSDGGNHKVIVKLDEKTAPRMFRRESGQFDGDKFVLWSGFADEFEFSRDYYELIKLWNIEKGIMEDEHLANFDFSRDKEITARRKE